MRLQNNQDKKSAGCWYLRCGEPGFALRLLAGILVLGMAVIGIKEFIFLSERALYHTRYFVKSGGNYDRFIYKYLRSPATALMVRELLPPDAVVEVSGSLDVDRVAMRYLLFPAQVKDRGDYLLDWGNRIKTVPTGWQVRRLYTGVSLYAKEGHGFVRNALGKRVTTQGWVLFVFAGVLVWQVFVGYCWLTFFNVGRNLGRWSFWANCFLLGYFVLTGAAWLFLAGGGTWDRLSLLLLWLFCLSVSWLALRSKTYRSVAWPKRMAEPARSAVLKWPTTLARYGFFLAVGQILAIIYQLPLSDWDGMSHWILKAKVFYYAQGLDLSYTHNNGYPLLWTLGPASLFVLSGGVFDAFAKWQSGIFFLAFVIQLQSGLKILGIQDRWRYLLGIFFLVLTFRDPLQQVRDYYYIFANAENIFMAYSTAVVVLIVSWLWAPTDKSPLRLGVFFALALALVKLEGAVTAVILLSAALVWGRRSLTRVDWYGVIGGLIVCVGLPLAWGRWVEAHSFSLGLSHFQGRVDAGKFLWQLSLIGQVVLTNNMLLIFLLAAGLLFVYGENRSWRREEKFLWLVFLSLSGFSAFSTLGWSADRTKYIFQEVFPRLFLHAVPALMFLWASRMGLYSRQK